MSRAQLSAAIGEQLDDLPVDEEAGSLKTAPNVRICLLRDAGSVADALEDEGLDDEDMDFLVDQAGLIVSIEKSGVINVRYYADEDELEDRWQDLCEDLNLPDTESDDEEPEDDDEDDDDEE